MFHCNCLCLIFDAGNGVGSLGLVLEIFYFQFETRDEFLLYYPGGEFWVLGTARGGFVPNVDNVMSKSLLYEMKRRNKSNSLRRVKLFRLYAKFYSFLIGRVGGDNCLEVTLVPILPMVRDCVLCIFWVNLSF